MSVGSQRSDHCMPEVGGGDAGVAVPRALRVGDRARRVEEPAQRVAGAARGWAERGGIAFGQVGVGDEDLDREVFGGFARHLLVVDAAERAGHDEQLATGLARDEPDLAVAVDREDRVLHRAEPGERADEDERLDARRQDPRHVRAFAHAARREPGGARVRTRRGTPRRSTCGPARRPPSPCRACARRAPRPTPRGSCPRCRCSRASATGGRRSRPRSRAHAHESHENVRTPRAIVPLSIAWIACSNSAIGYVTDTSSSRRISPRR